MAKEILNSQERGEILQVLGVLQSFQTFFDKLEDNTYTKGPQLTSQIKAAKNTISAAIKIAQDILRSDDKLEVASKKISLRRYTRAIENATDSVMQSVSSGVLKRTLEDAKTSKKNLDFADLLRSASKEEISSGREKQIRRTRKLPEDVHYEGILKTLRHFGITPTRAIGAGIASQIAAPIFGPFFGPLATLLGTGYTIRKLFPKLAYQPFRAARGIKRLITGEWKPDDSHKRIEEWMKGIPRRIGRWWREPVEGRREDEEEYEGPGGAYSPAVAPAVAGIGAMGGTPFRLLSRPKKEMATDPLFYFFNKRAYNAGWTKDVLSYLKKISGGGGGEGGIADSLLGSAIGSTIVSALTKAGVVGAAAFAAIQVTRAVISIRDLFVTTKDLGKSIVTPSIPAAEVIRGFAAKGGTPEEFRKQFGMTQEQYIKQEADILNYKHKMERGEVAKKMTSEVARESLTEVAIPAPIRLFTDAIINSFKATFFGREDSIKNQTKILEEIRDNTKKGTSPTPLGDFGNRVSPSTDSLNSPK